MPYVLVVVGLLMIITGIQNTYAQFGAQLQSDFSGSKSFIVYAIALFAVGALGYVKDLRQFSHYFMALILVSLVLSNKGFFQNFMAAIKAGPKAPQASATNSSASTVSTPIPTVQSPGAPATPSPPATGLGGQPAGQQMTFGQSVSAFFNHVLTSPAN